MLAGRRPLRADVEEVGSGQAQEEDRSVDRQRGDVVQDVDQPRLGEVQVVDDGDDRLALGEPSPAAA